MNALGWKHRGRNVDFASAFVTRRVYVRARESQEIVQKIFVNVHRFPFTQHCREIFYTVELEFKRGFGLLLDAEFVVFASFRITFTCKTLSRCTTLPLSDICKYCSRLLFVAFEVSGLFQFSRVKSQISPL